ncbi:MAG: hypothetical protein WCK02_15690 [Bacteroidota bacterium]
MRKLTFTLTMLLSFLGFSSLFAQTTLSVGDISIIGYRADATNALSFVTWVDLANNTEIRFTDNGWLSTGSFRTGEDSVVWVNNTGNVITKGTVITGVFSATTGVSPVWNIGTSTAGKLSGISTTGDQIFAYQGFITNPTLIFGLSVDGAWSANATTANNSALPTALNVWGGNLAVVPEIDNAEYSGGRTGLSVYLYKEAILDLNNWTTDNFGTTLVTLNATAFTILDGQVDLKLTQLIVPASACGLTNAENITVKVTNLGTIAVDSIPLVYTFDGITLYKDTILTSLLANHADTATLTFDNKANLSTAGIYNIVVYANFPQDNIKINDTLKSTITSIPLISTYPYLQDFETATNFWSSGAIAGTDIWQRGTPAKANIVGAASGTNAYATGLANNYSSNANIWLMTPCYDLSTLVNPMLSVKLNIYTEANNDAMILEYTTDGTAWVKLTGDAGFYNNTSATGSLPQPKWSGLVGSWNTYKTALTAVAGQANVKFRFRFVTNATTTNQGIAIDDFKIYDKPSYDIKVVQWMNPSSGCGLTNNESMIAKVTNLGALDIDSIPMAYSINAGVTLVKDTIFSTLHANGTDTITFTFPTKADFSVNGIYNCGIAASLANEGDRTNDTIFSQVTSIPLISTYPYLQDFETATNFWSSGAIAGTDIWQRGTPAKANIVGAASGTNAYATGLANNYSSNANIWLMTPCYDLSTLGGF